MTSTFVDWLLPALLLVAAGWDVWKLEIPNGLCLLLAVGFLAAAVLAGLPWPQVLQQLLIGCAALAVGIVLFAFRLLGGGDGKLLAAMLPWYHPAAVPALLLATALAGGVIALLLLGLRRAPLPAGLRQREWPARLLNQGSGIPYAPAIAAAGLLAFGQLAWSPAA